MNTALDSQTFGFIPITNQHYSGIPFSPHLFSPSPRDPYSLGCGPFSSQNSSSEENSILIKSVFESNDMSHHLYYSQPTLHLVPHDTNGRQLSSYTDPDCRERQEMQSNIHNSNSTAAQQSQQLIKQPTAPMFPHLSSVMDDFPQRLYNPKKKRLAAYEEDHITSVNSSTNIAESLQSPERTSHLTYVRDVMNISGGKVGDIKPTDCHSSSYSQGKHAFLVNNPSTNEMTPSSSSPSYRFINPSYASSSQMTINMFPDQHISPHFLLTNLSHPPSSSSSATALRPCNSNDVSFKSRDYSDRLSPLRINSSLEPILKQESLESNSCDQTLQPFLQDSSRSSEESCVNAKTSLKGFLTSDSYKGYSKVIDSKYGQGDESSPVIQTIPVNVCQKESKISMSKDSPGTSSGLIEGCWPEQELTAYKDIKDRRLCQICGDISAGFHCNAFICEACKKFFIRSSKGNNHGKYSCTKQGNCEILKDTRTHCQYCRYQKCLLIGMTLPGTNQTNNTDISIIPCRVCNAHSSGFHFGAITCEGCKGFFRRSIIERDKRGYVCNRNGNCVINPANRNSCKACRYKRCLAAGMSKDASRIGRQPNAVKFICAQEIQRLRRYEDDSSPTGNSTTNVMRQAMFSPQKTPSHSLNNLSATNYLDSISSEIQQNQSGFCSALKSIPSSESIFPQPGEIYTSPNYYSYSSGSTPGLSSCPTGPYATTNSIESVRMRHNSTSSGCSTVCTYFREGQPSAAGSSPYLSRALNSNDSPNEYNPLKDNHGYHEYQMMTMKSMDAYGNISNGTSDDHHDYNAETSGSETSHSHPPPILRLLSGEQPRVKYTKVPEEFQAYIHQTTVAAQNLRYFSERATENFESENVSNESELWCNMMRHFQVHARSITDFAKGVPGFSQLTLKDKKLVVKESMYPIILLRLSLDYNQMTNEFNYFDFTTERRELILHMFPSFRRIADHLTHSGRLLSRHNMTEEEMALLCAVALFKEDSFSLVCEPDKVKVLYNNAVEALEYYESDIRCLSNRCQQLIEALHSLFNMNQEHHNIVSTLKMQRPHLNFPFLYVEMFQLRDEDSSTGNVSQMSKELMNNQLKADGGDNFGRK